MPVRRWCHRILSIARMPDLSNHRNTKSLLQETKPLLKGASEFGTKTHFHRRIRGIISRDDDLPSQDPRIQIEAKRLMDEYS